MDSNSKATVIAALIGGLFVCAAAFIGLFTPITSRLAEALFNANPTPTQAALVQPVAPTTISQTSAPTQTVPSTQPTAPAAPPLTLIVINDLPFAQTIYLNGVMSGYVETGAYVTFSYARGKFLLQNCPNGMNPQEHLTSCGTHQEDVQTDPYIWYMEGSAPPSDSQVTFIARNITQTPYDLFVDNKFDTSLDPAKYIIQRLPQGAHTLQSCLRSTTPQTSPSTCLPAQNVNLQVAVFPFDITN